MPEPAGPYGYKWYWMMMVVAHSQATLRLYLTVVKRKNLGVVRD